MARIFFLLICSTWLVVPAWSQKKASILDPKTIQVSWELVENYYHDKPQFLSAFTFTNTGKKAVPATGWSLYYNIARAVLPETVTGNVTITNINGDLFKLSPAAGFGGLAPGASLRVEFVSPAWAVNFTDAPLGLFWVLDPNPGQGIAVTNYKIKPSTEPKQARRNAGDKVPFTTPAITFEQNAVIRDLPLQGLPKVFPSPIEYRETNETFPLTGTVSIVTDPAFRPEAEYLVAELTKLLDKKPAVTDAAPAGPTIRLQKGNTKPEGYQLSVKSNVIAISASDNAGIFYGIQSLKSLLPPTSWVGVKNSIDVPGVEVKDAPRFDVRSFMLDVGRNFQPKAQILKTLDVLSFYKINVFHFHFSEDEGWRIEMPSLPELTAIGSKRGFPLDESKQLIPSFASGPNQSTRGTGHYSKADFIEILRYAHARHIKVIPEIETPGHARAAVISMKARYERLLKEGKTAEANEFVLHDPADKSEYRSVQGWRDNVMNVALPSTYRFLGKVFDDLIAMYKEAGAPLETIHVGGDEVPAGVWEKSPACLELMKNDATIKDVDHLWYYYYGKVNQLLKARGLTLYGWEEVAMRKTKLDGNKTWIVNPKFVNENFKVDVWNNVLGWGAEDLAYRLANAGVKVVLSPVSNVYFDMSYTKAFDEPGYYWGGYSDMDKTFYYIPFDYYKNSRIDGMGNPLPNNFFLGKDRLSDFGKENTVGIQGLLWSETIFSEQHMEYMLFPKLLSLSERAWAVDPAWATEPDTARSAAMYKEAWSGFANLVGKKELAKLDYYAGGFQYRIPTAGAVVANGQVTANVQLPGLVIRYTTDGSEPDLNSKNYTGPITEKGKVRLKVFNAKGRGGRSVEVVNN